MPGPLQQSKATHTSHDEIGASLESPMDTEISGSGELSWNSGYCCVPSNRISDLSELVHSGFVREGNNTNLVFLLKKKTREFAFSSTFT